MRDDWKRAIEEAKKNIGTIKPSKPIALPRYLYEQLKRLEDKK